MLSQTVLSDALAALDTPALVLDMERSAGATASDVLKVTAYIVDVERWPRFNAVYAEVMGNARPARAVVPVAQLHYGYLVEVDAIAVCSGGSRHQDLPR